MVSFREAGLRVTENFTVPIAPLNSSDNLSKYSKSSNMARIMPPVRVGTCLLRLAITMEAPYCSGIPGGNDAVAEEADSLVVITKCSGTALTPQVRAYLMGLPKAGGEK